MAKKLFLKELDNYTKWAIDDYEKINVSIARGTHSYMHSHNFLEIAYIVKGTAIHHMNGEDVIISSGDYVIIDYNTMHTYDQVGSEELIVINCLFLPDFIDKTLKNCLSFSQVLENYRIHHSNTSVYVNTSNHFFHDSDEEILDILEKLLNEYKDKHVGYIEIMRCMLIELIISTIRKVQIQNNSHFSNIEKYIMQLVEEKYMEPITLNDIANDLHYSTSYISKKFKQNCGMSFKQFLQKTRIEESCRLLANTNKKIPDIATLVGYDDIKFFTATFSKIMNISPREYRKLHHSK